MLKNLMFITLALVWMPKSAFGDTGHLYDNVIAPLIAKCPDFLSGDAQIKASVNYSVWATGVHSYHATCEIPVKKGSRAIGKRVEITTKVHDGPDGDPDDDGDECEIGSIIQPTTRTLGEMVDIAGTNFDLAYFSDKVKGRTARYAMDFEVNDVNSNVTGFRVYAEYANGRVLDETFSNVADQMYSFVWDGLDGSSVPLLGSVLFRPTVTVYAHGKEIPITYHGYYIGVVDAKMFGFGLWTPTIYHFYDVYQKRLVFGNGTARYVSAKVLPDNNLMVAAKNVSEVYIFNPQGRHLYTKFPITGENKYSFEHDIYSKLIAIHEPFGRSTTFTYTGLNATQILSPDGLVTNLSYDSNGYLKKIVSPMGYTHEMTYTAYGLLTSFRKPEGELNSFYYDSRGRLTLDYHSSGFFQEISSYKTPGESHSMTYVVKTPMNRETKYNNANSLLSAKEYNTAIDSPSMSSYSKRSQDTSLTEFWYNSYRKSSSFKPDPRFPESGQYTGYAQLAIKGIGAPIYSNLSANLSTPSDPFSVIDITNTQTKSSKTGTAHFSRSNNEWTYTSPEGRITKRKIDEFERTVSIKNGIDAPVEFYYNSQGRLSEVSQGNRKNKLFYDGNGYLKRMVNTSGQEVNFENDLHGNTLRTTTPDGRIRSYQYDKNGKLLSITPPGRQPHSFLYNVFEVLKSYVPPELGGSEVATKYDYNRDKQVTRVQRPDGQEINYAYTATGGNIEQILTPLGSYSYNYNPFINMVTQAISPSGVETQRDYHGPFIREERQFLSSPYVLTAKQTWSFNDEHLPIRATITDSANQKFSYSISYDKDDFVTRKGWMAYGRDHNGRIVEARLDNSSIVYSYDSIYGEMDKIEFLLNGNKQILQNYTRDKSGLIISESTGAQTFHYLYDQQRRFIRKALKSGKIIEENKYDGNGNRILAVSNGVTKIGQYDEQDRLISWSDLQFTYNENGDLQSKYDSSNNETTSYQYDVFGNLLQVTMPNSDTISYGVDGFNRRVFRSVNGIVSSRYIYKDSLRIGAELTSSGVLLKQFIYEHDINVPDYMDYGGQRYIFIKDIRGSVLKVLNSKSGHVAQELSYDTWGRVIDDSNPGFQPFGFAGGLYDSETKLTRFGARDYDAETGRWLSKDPIGFDGGDTNLYGYVLADPVNYFDPMGLWSISFGAYAGIGGAITVGKNPNGGWFGSVNIGYGVGGGVLFDTDGTSPGYGTGTQGPAVEAGLFCEAGINIGPASAGAGAAGGWVIPADPKLPSPMYWTVGPVLGVTPSYGFAAGAAAGGQVTFR